VEGFNVVGTLLGFLAIPVLGLAALVALGLWVASRTRAALIVFASGWLCAAALIAVATLTFLSRDEFNPDGNGPLLVATAVALFVVGVGQFVAALRGPGVYVPAFACAMVSLGLLVAPFLGDRVAHNLDVHPSLTEWQEDLIVQCFVFASLLPAFAGLLLALLVRQKAVPNEI
jgi:hypothetical protein